MPTPAPDARAPDVVIIGAGPAGLTAAYVLHQARASRVTVLEADNVVGGISRTAERDGWRFDIGGHRFFTKVKPVEDLWFEILGPDDFLRRPRLSRIYYRGKFYDYPIVADERARATSGPVEAVRCMASYLWVRIQPPEGQDHARRLRRVALRLAPVRALLQDAEREGVGRAVHRDPGRLGRAAHQEPVAVPGGVGGADAEAAAHAPRQARSRSRA